MCTLFTKFPLGNYLFPQRILFYYKLSYFFYHFWSSRLLWDESFRLRSIIWSAYVNPLFQEENVLRGQQYQEDCARLQ
jgi:hypothetical protein